MRGSDRERKGGSDGGRREHAENNVIKFNKHNINLCINNRVSKTFVFQFFISI